MNKADNVPIATLSGIACLTEIASELPLPCSNSSSKTVQLFGSQQAAVASNNEIRKTQSAEEMQKVVGLLADVNTAYLDFKNSSYNCSMSLNDPSKLPVGLQQALHIDPTIFQPQFDNYHGSPLKSNSLAALAYSPNQRNAFIRQQALLQQQQQLQQQPDHSQQFKGHHVQHLFRKEPQVSNISSGHSSQTLQAHHTYHVQDEQQQQLQQQQFINIQSQQLLQHQQQQHGNQQQHQQQHGNHQQHQQQHGNHQQQQQALVPVQKQLAHVQEQLAHVQEQLASVREQPVYTPEPIVSAKQPPTVKPTAIVRAQPIYQPSVKIEQVKAELTKASVKTQAIQQEEKNDQTLFSPLKTRGQRQEQAPVSTVLPVKVETAITAGTTQVGEPKLELRVPKLIVRKIKRKEGDNEVETLEVCSPGKEHPDIYDNSIAKDYPEIPTINKKRSKSKHSRRSSRSSMGSVDSFKERQQQQRHQHQKRKKKALSTSSSDGTDGGLEQEIKRFRADSTDDVEGVEVKVELKKFMFTLDKILDRELELEAEGELDINDDVEIPPQTLLPKPLVSTFSSEIAKVKSSNSLNEVPVDQLVRVMSVMDRHVRDTMSLNITQDEDEESKMWLTIQSERIVRSAEAATTILNITTAPNMPKQVYLEEAIEHVAMFCQYQLENVIYPEFDGIYKLPETKDAFSYKGKRHYRSSTTLKRKPTLKIYNKICEVVSLLGDLVEVENLTDSIILKISQIGISPFFVENVNVLQLEALKVSRTVFRNYVKHRDLILDDILASLTRLSSNKRNLRNYRLQDNVCIQMFTALVLQLVQCTVQIPERFGEDDENNKNDLLIDKDVLIVKSYEDALRAAQNFMGIFLKKCSSNSKDENDFRPLFENFLHDLFLSANLPEWPAAEVLLTQLGRLFVVTFSNPKNDMSLRSTALDYLAQIATHLRKSVMESQSEVEVDKLKLIVDRLINVDGDEDTPVVEDMDVYDEKLRRSLLQYLLSCIQQDSSFKYAREFYLGQWIRDVQIEIEKSMIAPMLSIPGAATVTSVGDEDEKVKTEVSAEKLQILQEKKDFYHTLIRDKVVSTLRSAQQLSYENSCVVVNHLASTRPFSQSFDLYMQQIFKMLSEQAIGLRTKAVKALTLIVSVDETILAREDVQASVHGRLLDPSTNVREAAVDLIGQFVLKCPELIKQYYDMIIARILDTGVSVRKRVIKILKDICIERPDYEKIPEICSKMIRRVDDEVGIKKLVTEVFRSMWFQPLSDVTKQANELYTRAINVTKVVSLCKDTGFDWLESLLENLFDPDNPSSRSATIKACQQLVDCLVLRMLKPGHKPDSNAVNSCLVTLCMFCNSYPKLLVPHASTLQPYLSSKISTQSDTLIIQNVSKILEQIVPLMEHPNPKFLADLEEDTMKLLLKQSQNVVQSSASCLAAIINNCTHNFKFIVDAFNTFYRFLTSYKGEHTKNPTNQLMSKRRPSLLRALFTIALFCRYFDLDKHIPECSASSSGNKQAASQVDTNKPVTTTTKVFELVLYFTDFQDEEIATKALLSLGFIGIRYPHLLLLEQCRKLYQEILSPDYTSVKSKYIILKNLQNHLTEEEQRLRNAEGHKTPVKKKKPSKDVEFDDKTDIKEMGDALSGNTSEIVQVFLKDIMKCFLHTEKQIRTLALQVIVIILRQGLVHPAQCIPYLIAISTDNEKLCHVKAEQSLNDLDNRYQGFIHMKALHGVKMSYELQTVIQKNNNEYLCGYRETDNKMALLNHVYNMLRTNKQYRRPYILSFLKLIDDKKTSSGMLYYLVENVAYTSYSTQEEPLFIIHHIDTIASVSGTNILQSFKEVLHGSEASNTVYDDDDENEEKLSQESRFDTDKLKEVTRESFGCLLLLELKTYLKMLYGFTDNKCQKYSPSQPSKLYDKSITRKANQDFESEYKTLIFSKDLFKEEMLDYYFQFKQLMLSLDTEKDSDSEEAQPEQQQCQPRHEEQSDDGDQIPPADEATPKEEHQESLSTQNHVKIETPVDVPEEKPPIPMEQYDS